jgi:hypothetical protein
MDQEPLGQNPNQQIPEQQQAANTFSPKPNRKLWVIIPAAVLLVIAAGVLGYWQYRQRQANKQPITQNNIVNYPNNPITSATGTQPQPGNLNYSTTTPPATNDFVNSFESTACNNPLPAVASRSGLVQWVQPEKQNNLKIFATTTPNSDYIRDDSYLVGHVLGGKYQGGDFILAVVSYMGMGISEEYVDIIRLDGQYFYLTNYSNGFNPSSPDMKPLVKLAEVGDFDLPDLNFPEKLHSDNPSADFSAVTQFAFYQGNKQPFCGDNLVKAFTDPVIGDIYTDAVTQLDNPNGGKYPTFGGFYVKAPDGTKRTYQLDIPIIGPDKVPLLTWNNGKKNSAEYSYQAIGGCGVSKLRDVADVKLSDLTQIGVAFGGQAVYGYKDSNADELKTTFDAIYTPDGQTKPSYAKFLADNPIFFWQDPFGQFVRFKIMKYQPMAECGKPVIYLYPEQTEKISVSLSPVGGFTYTEPAYNGGWNVISDPQSNITNLADGKKYPYLFWEGRGGIYQTPDKGFVVSRDGAHLFFEDKLSQAGLNAKERKDFEEFWEPKMQGSPYYFVTFMGNQVMDELAPLSVTPKPDTIIRILMDFTPFEHPINVQGYNIRTPERKGFTVVEWGGVLRSEQK